MNIHNPYRDVFIPALVAVAVHNDLHSQIFGLLSSPDADLGAGDGLDDDGGMLKTTEYPGV